MTHAQIVTTFGHFMTQPTKPKFSFFQKLEFEFSRIEHVVVDFAGTDNL